ncbi:nineteen complex-related protein 2-domain-containing protein [Limtongia smithiae]|uniref:nineteen complex-related protein 2-domain-containing protein n=1 Tax=Limtongia smithiae TaxID=1125753 RepID=UPI0034CF4E25
MSLHGLSQARKKQSRRLIVDSPSPEPTAPSTTTASQRNTNTDENEEDDEYRIVTAASLRKKQKPKTQGGISANSALKAKLRAKLAPSFPTSSADPGAGTNAQNDYSLSYLEELRDATPATPTFFSAAENETVSTAGVVVVDDEDMPDAGFEVNAAMADDIDVPDEAFIAHMLEKRRQLASQSASASAPSAAKDFISLDDSASNHNSDDNESTSGVDPAPRESRLQHDDDLAENMDDVIAEGSDGRIPLSAAQEREQARRRRQDIEEMILEREEEEEGQDDTLYRREGDGDGESDSDGAWEDAQIQKGAFGMAAAAARDRETTRHQPSAAPVVLPEIPSLDAVLLRLLRKIEGITEHRDELRQALDRLQEEQESIERKENDLKEALNNPEFARIATGAR